MQARALKRDSSGDGDPLILVPGGLTGWISWIPHQDRLSSNRRALRVLPIHNELGSAGKPGDPCYTKRLSGTVSVSHWTSSVSKRLPSRDGQREARP